MGRPELGHLLTHGYLIPATSIVALLKVESEQMPDCLR